MKVPKPIQMSSGNWYIQLRLGGDRYNITGITDKDCIRKAELVKAQYRNGIRQEKQEEKHLPTLGQILDDYISKYESVLSPSTIMGYSSVRRNRFPDYVDTPLNEIDDWQEMINAELALSSVKTVRNGWGAYTAAMRDINYPVPSVKLAKTVKKDLPFLEPEEIPLFLKAIEGDSCEIDMLLELHGLRQSEALQVVRNRQFDLKHNLIIVSGAIVPDKNYKRVEKDSNKTSKSTREVQIMIPRLAELVKPYVENQQSIPEHSALTVLKHVHKACEKAGITDVSNHGLRRTCASLGYSLGVPERIIMDIGGWSDPEMVHRLYIKLSRRDKAKARTAMSDFYEAKEKTPDELLSDAMNDLIDFQKRYESLPQLSPIFKQISKMQSKMQS